MKKPISHELVKGKLFITLLFILIASTNLCWAQVIPPVPPPTKAGCFRFNMTYQPCGSSWTENYNGVTYNCFCDCSSITANDCVPSSSPGQADPGQVNPGPVNNPGQENAGDVSIFGPENGKPIFNSHPSQAFEDYAKNYAQLQKSMGFASYLGNALTPPKIPLTENNVFNIAYSKFVSEFNPSHQDASAVDLIGKKGVINPNDFTKNGKGIIDPNILKANDPEYKGIKLISMPPLPDGESEIKVTRLKGIDDAREIAVDVFSLLPPGLNYATIAAIDAVAMDARVLHACMTDNCPTSGEVFEELTVNILRDIGSAAFAHLLHTSGSNYFKSAEVFKLVEKEQWGIAPLINIKIKAKNGRDIATILEVTGSKIKPLTSKIEEMLPGEKVQESTW